MPVPIPTGRILNSSITVTSRAWSNVGGQRTPTDTTATFRASVQPMKADRRVLFDLDLGVSAWTVYLAQDPDVKVDDLITWQGRTLACLGRARDEAGRGTVWAVDCSEKT